MLFVSQIAGLQIPTVKAQESCLKIYYDSEKGYYYFWTLNREKVVLEKSGFAVLNRWDGEARLKFGSFPLVGEVEIEVEAELLENKLKWKGKWKIGEREVEVEIELEPKNVSEYGDLEWSMKLTDKLPINVFSMPIQSENLKFYYQPPLFQEYGFSEPFSNSTFFVNATHVMRLVNGIWVNEVYRPENVVGSYAVYHATKTPWHKSREEAEKYRAGKAFHIYRPKLIDAEGKTAWADLNIDEKRGVLTITLPQEFLDKASFPVVVDPTFGYETAGSSSHTATDNYMHGYGYQNPGESGTAESISIYKYQGARKFMLIIYRQSDQALIGYTEEHEGVASTGWHTLNIASGGNLESVDYIFMDWRDNDCTLYFDSWDYYIFYKSETYTGSPPDPGNLKQSSYSKRRYSIYCTYTAGGGAQEYSHSFIETLNPSATLNLWQAQSYTFTQTMVITSTYNYGAEAIYTFTQTIKPSETITYLQEQIWLIQELMQTSSTSSIMQEQSYILTQTIKPSETVTYYQEHIHIMHESFSVSEQLQPIQAEGIFTLIQTIKPSESITYMQEQKYILTETVAPASTFQHWIEGITIFTETFTETIHPSTTIRYWIELAYEFPETFNPQTQFQLKGIETFYALIEVLTGTTEHEIAKELLQAFYETLKPATAFNYAAELTETFITIIETLKPKTTIIPILPSPTPEEINWGIIALGFAILAFTLATTALTTKRD